MSGVFVGFVAEDGLLKLDFPQQFKAFVARKFKGCEVEIEVRPKGTKRTLAQSAGYHAMLAPWARDEGHAIEDLKDDCLEAVFGLREKVNTITGEVSRVLAQPHTSTLTVAQFSELIERTLEIAARTGYVLTPPDEYRRQHPERYPQKKRRAA